MPSMKAKEIREASEDELKKRLTDLQTELVRQRTMVRAGGSVENPSRIRDLRKNIARIHTVMNEKGRKTE
jgi:large subunit ribosomal protein L29